jgi:hypothetical protein
MLKPQKTVIFRYLWDGSPPANNLIVFDSPGLGNHMRKILCVGLGMAVAACASKSIDVAPSYVSPIQYNNYTCDQLQAEAQRVSHHAMAAAGAQDKRRSNDAVATTVGVVLFWPSLFFIKGDNEKTAELARLRGEMEAIEQISIQKNCGIVFQREPPPRPKRKSVYD